MNEVFKYLIFNFKLLIVILNPFNAWVIKLSKRESRNDLVCSFFFILSIADLIKASIKLFLSFNKISLICSSVILLISNSQETSFKFNLRELPFSSGISINKFFIDNELIVIWGYISKFCFRVIFSYFNRPSLNIDKNCSLFISGEIYLLKCPEKRPYIWSPYSRKLNFDIFNK